MTRPVRNKNPRRNEGNKSGETAASQQRNRALRFKEEEASERVPKREPWQEWEIFKEIQNLPKIPEI